MKRRVVILILLFPALLLAAALAAWIWLWHTESGARWAWQQAAVRLAESPRKSSLEARVQGTLKRGLRLESLSYRDNDVTVTADTVALAGGLNLSPVMLTVFNLHARGVEVMIHRDTAQEGPGASPLAELDLRTPLPIIVQALVIDSALISQGEQSVSIERIQARGEWFERLDLEIKNVEARALTGALTVESDLTPPFALESEIRIDRFEIPAAVQAEIPWLPPTFESEWTVSGDIDALGIEGELRWPEWMPAAEVAGRIEQPLQDFAWDARLTLPRATIPGNWVEGRLGTAQGELESIVVKQFGVDANGTRTNYEFSGKTALESSWLESDQMAFEGAGDASAPLRWSVGGEAAIHASGWPSGTATIRAGQDASGFRASLDAPELFGGSLSVSAQAERGARTPWQSELTARNLATTPLIEALAPHIGGELLSSLTSVRKALEVDQLDARIMASGRLEPLEFSVEIENLEGTVRRRDVTARGQLEYGDKGMAVSGLALESGDSRIVANGSFEGPPGLDLEVAISDLEDLLPDSAGRLTGTLHYRHDPSRGFAVSGLNGDLEGSDFQAFGWTVATLNITAADAPPAVSLEASDIDGPAGPIEQLSARLKGDLDAHEAAVTARTRGVMLEAGISGGLAESGAGWSGTLDRLEVAPPEGPHWALREPAALSLDEFTEIQSACLTPGDTTALCLDIRHQAGDGQLGRLRLASFSPNFVAQLADWPLSFTQEINGELSWRRRASEALSATAEFAITQGVIVDQTENVEMLNTGDGMFGFSLERGSLQAGKIDIPFDGGVIDVDFTVPDFLAGEESAISGKIHVDVDDLQALSNFIPQLSQTAGMLALDVDVSGTAGDPKFNGMIELKDGRVNVPAAGTRFSDVEVVGQLHGDEKIRLDGAFLAGEGQGRLLATLDFSTLSEPTFEAQLDGTGLALIDVPEIQLKADTDLQVDWDGTTLALSGRIHVPTARFAPSYLPSDTASESPDVVIVSGGEQSETPRSNGRAWKIAGALEVSMGDDVVIDLELATATMTGTANFNWTGKPIPAASGQYDLKGEIQAYGQQLEITRATIRYPEGALANNPHLDVRAERRIYGNSMITRAGVFVHGTLKRPLTEPYTVPATNADRARALLITGSDFDYEQGVGAVNVGTYIAPKLYLSYGVGLFEEGNVITARYELKNNLGVKATSGQDETGIDVSYTIER